MSIAKTLTRQQMQLQQLPSPYLVKACSLACWQYCWVNRTSSCHFSAGAGHVPLTSSCMLAVPCCSLSCWSHDMI